jgi:hypothetical protein
MPVRCGADLGVARPASRGDEARTPTCATAGTPRPYHGGMAAVPPSRRVGADRPGCDDVRLAGEQRKARPMDRREALWRRLGKEMVRAWLGLWYL